MLRRTRRILRFAALLVSAVMAVGALTLWVAVVLVPPSSSRTYGLAKGRDTQRQYFDRRRISRTYFMLWYSPDMWTLFDAQAHGPGDGIRTAGGSSFILSGHFDRNEEFAMPLFRFNRWGFFAYSVSSQNPAWSPTEWLWADRPLYHYSFSFRVPLWFPVLLGAISTAAFLRGPVRRWRRRRRNLCIHCGYNLTGNTTGRCSECGRETTKAQRHKELKRLEDEDLSGNSEVKQP